jgi:hypothetical protein
MSDLFSSLLIFTIIKTILSTFFFTVSNFYKNFVKWALTEIESSVAGTTTLDREWISRYSLFFLEYLEETQERRNI